jgi:hypothetical protein
MARDNEKMDWDAIEPSRSRLRALVTRVTRELAEVEGNARGERADLASLSLAWTSLVGELDLGAEPALRACPHCGRSILLVAVRCRYCMSRSPAAGAA